MSLTTGVRSEIRSLVWSLEEGGDAERVKRHGSEMIRLLDKVDAVFREESSDAHDLDALLSALEDWDRERYPKWKEIALGTLRDTARECRERKRRRAK